METLRNRTVEGGDLSRTIGSTIQRPGGSNAIMVNPSRYRSPRGKVGRTRQPENVSKVKKLRTLLFQGLFMLAAFSCVALLYHILVFVEDENLQLYGDFATDLLLKLVLSLVIPQRLLVNRLMRHYAKNRISRFISRFRN